MRALALQTPDKVPNATANMNENQHAEKKLYKKMDSQLELM